MTRVLVTGASGFVGQHLLNILVEQRDEVVGLALPGTFTPDFPDEVRNIEVDLLDSVLLARIVRDIGPDYVYHLAALVANASLQELFRVNVIGTRNLLDALARLDDRVTRILITGSAAEYGLVRDDELPVTEDQPLRPMSPYGLSKVMQGLLAQQYFLCHGLPIVHTRAFNISGPGEPSSLVCAAFARQIAEMEVRTKEPVLLVGDLQSERDFIDVRDVVRGFIAVIERGQNGKVYNLCSGQATRIESILQSLLALTDVPILVEADPGRMNASDVPRSVGDPRRVYRQTGWRPLIPLSDTLQDLLTYWRKLVRNERANSKQG